MKTVSKSSFTLFELLIVILIISIIYGLFVEKISTKEHQIKSKGIKEIRTLLESLDFNESARIVCTDTCNSCFIETDGKKIQDIKLLEDKIKVYDFDINGILTQIKFTPIFEDQNPKDVCFEYKLNANGSASSYIVEYKNKFYIFFSYMKPVQTADTITKARALFDMSQWLPIDSSDYNF